MRGSLLIADVHAVLEEGRAADDHAGVRMSG